MLKCKNYMNIERYIKQYKKFTGVKQLLLGLLVLVILILFVLTLEGRNIILIHSLIIYIVICLIESLVKILK